jgi:HAMP domain-containing protein
MRNKVIIIAALFIFCGYIKAFAEITIKSEIDKLKITTDDTITYKLIITSTAKNIPEPRVPDFTGFAVVSQAQSSTISFIKSGIKSILVYAYILAPLESGKFKIKPSQIKVKNKIVSSQGFEIEVKPAKPGTKNLSEEKPVPLPETPSESEQPQVTL